MNIPMGNIKTFKPSLAFLVGLGHLVLGWIFFSYGKSYNIDAYYWAMLLTIIISIPYFIDAIRLNFVIYEPKYLFLEAFLVCGTSVMFLNVDLIDLDVVLWAQVLRLFCIGVTAYLIGYGSQIGKVMAKVTPCSIFNKMEFSDYKIPIFLYLLGWSLRVAYMCLVRFDPLGPLLRSFNSVMGWQVISIVFTQSIYIALMLDCNSVFSNVHPVDNWKRKKTFLRFLILLGCELIYSFTAIGMKESVMIPLLLVFVIYMKATRKIPKILLVGVVVMYVGLVMPFMNSVRAEREGHNDFQDSMEGAYEDLFVDENIAERRQEAISRISNSLEMSIRCLEARVIGNSFKTFSDPLSYVVTFVPRVIWPDKPSVNYNEIGKKLGILNDDDFKTSIGLTMMGGIAMNYGTMGAVIFMFLTGALHRFYWEWLIVKTGDNFGAFIVFFLLMYVWMRLPEIGFAINANASMLVYLVIFLRIMFYRRTREDRISV
jgi:hypothetical protein